MLFRHQSAGPARPALALAALIGCLASSLGGAYATSHMATTVDRSRVDERLQRLAAEEVRAALSRHDATSAAVVVVEPRTGHVLAFAEAGNGAWERRTIGPGSVVKPLIAEAALAAGVATPDTVLDCRGPVTVDGRVFNDHTAFGPMTLTEAVARSSNICGIRLAQMVGLERVKAALAGFGLTDEVVQAGDSDGVRLARLSVGQTVSATVTTLARAYARLATEGSDATKAILVRAVEDGTGRRAAIAGHAVAGKTGTMTTGRAPAKEEFSFVDQSYGILASFVGFVPAQAPRFVVYAVVENAKTSPSGSTGGGAVAAPLFQKVARRALALPARAK